MMMGTYVSQLEKMVFLDNDLSQVPEVIDTRFGKITLRRDAAVSFPRGLLGMPNRRNFFMTEFPSDKLAGYKLLQSLDDYNLSFITLPMPVTSHNGIIAPEDIKAACVDLGILPENLMVLLVVSVHRSPDKVAISVNARAPLLIDTSLKLAAQYVFHNDKYNVQHYI